MSALRKAFDELPEQTRKFFRALVDAVEGQARTHAERAGLEQELAEARSECETVGAQLATAKRDCDANRRIFDEAVARLEIADQAHRLLAECVRSGYVRDAAITFINAHPVPPLSDEAGTFPARPRPRLQEGT